MAILQVGPRTTMKGLWKSCTLRFFHKLDPKSESSGLLRWRATTPLEQVSDMTASKYQLRLLNRLEGARRLILHRYYVRVWKHVSDDPDDPIWRLELRLERVREQISVDALQFIPTPAQFDDWKMYQGYLKKTTMQAMRGHSTNLVTHLVRPSDIAARASVARPKDVRETEWAFDEIFE